MEDNNLLEMFAGLGKKQLAGSLTGGAKSLFGSGVAESGMMQGAIGGMSSVAAPLAALDMTAGFAGDIIGGNATDKLDTLGTDTAFQTSGFADRNTNMLSSIKRGLGTEEVSNRAETLSSIPMVGGIASLFSNINLSKKAKQATQKYNRTMPYMQAAESNEIGASIQNQAQTYQAPAYGRKGMKLQHKTKFSY